MARDGRGPRVKWEISAYVQDIRDNWNYYASRNIWRLDRRFHQEALDGFIAKTVGKAAEGLQRLGSCRSD